MHFSVESKLTPFDIVERAVAFFGKGGIGLVTVKKDKESASFEGGGGFVTITVCPGDKTTVDLQTREWEYQVKDFIQEIKG